MVQKLVNDYGLDFILVVPIEWFWKVVENYGWTNYQSSLGYENCSGWMGEAEYEQNKMQPTNPNAVT